MQFFFTLLGMALMPFMHAQEFEWARQLTGSDSDFIQDMVVDGSGNIYLVGVHLNSFDLDPGPGTLAGNPAQTNIWLAKYTASGNLVWGKFLTSGFDKFAHSIDLDTQGNIYISGNYFIDLNIDGLVINDTGNDGAFFLAKFNNNGVRQWVSNFGEGTGRGVGKAVTVDGNNNVWFSGEFSGQVDFDPGPGSVPRQSSFGQNFLSKYSSNGSLILVNNFGAQSGSLSRVEDMVADNANNIYLTGGLEGSGVNFNPGGAGSGLNSSNGRSYVAKYNSSGAFQWAEQIPGNIIFDGSWGLALDGQQNIYVTGIANSNIFLNKYNSSGGLLISKTFAGSTSLDQGIAVAVNPANDVFLTGAVRQTVNFGNGVSITVPGITDIFFAKFDSNLNAQWAFNTELLGTGDVDVRGEALHATNNSLIVAGNFKETTDFNPCGVTTPFSANDLDGFFVKIDPSDIDLNISGPDKVCVSNTTFTVSGLPPGATVTWSGTSRLTLVSQSPSSAVFRATSSATTGPATISVRVTSGCIDFTEDKEVWVGKPGFDNASINGNNTVNCYSTYIYDLFGFIEGCASYVWETSGHLDDVSSIPSEELFVEPTNAGEAFVAIKATNSCGTNYLCKSVQVSTSYPCGPELVTFPGSHPCAPLGVILLSVYPNPSSHGFEIEIPGLAETLKRESGKNFKTGQGIQILMYNMNQILVYESSMLKDRHFISTELFEKGIYVLKLSYKGNEFSSQNIIVH